MIDIPKKKDAKSLRNFGAAIYGEHSEDPYPLQTRKLLVDIAIKFWDIYKTYPDVHVRGEWKALKYILQGFRNGAENNNDMQTAKYASKKIKELIV